MNKNFIPYHLRQNKAIDRNLFVDLLVRINSIFKIRDYEYISMGGPFLEDFKLIHAATGIRKMVSFEMDPNTFARQKFNKPLSCIRLLNVTSSDLVRSYQFNRSVIVWLDFTTPEHLSRDLNDVFDLVSKLNSGDILKVTLNANAASINIPSNIDYNEKPKKRFEYLENLLGNYLPEEVIPSEITGAGYPYVLFRVLQLVVDRAIKSTSSLYFHPLTSFIYADGQTMLTFSGVILEKGATEKFLTKSGMRTWDLSLERNLKPISINVPELSIKERMLLDSLLPNYSPQTIQKRLKYKVAEKTGDSAKGIENYTRYYNQFPYFSKVVL